MPAHSSTGSRIVGLDLARGLAFLGMVIVNYKIILGFGASDPRWLSEFLNHFTGRAAPLYVLLAGIGTTLLFSAGRRRADASPVTGPRRSAGDHFKTALIVLFCVLGVLVAGYHGFCDQNDLKTLTLAKSLNALTGGDDTVFEDVPTRISDYGTAIRNGEINALLMWSGGALALFVLTWILWGSRDGRWRLLRRALFLLALGYAWYPWWAGDILHWYGVFLCIGALLVGARWWLVLPALALTLCVRPYFRAVEGWPDWVGWSLTLDYKAFWEPLGQARHLLYNGWHPVFPWLVFFLAGLLVGRLALARASTAVVIILIGAALWLGTKHAAPEIQDALKEASWQNAGETFAAKPLSIPEGWKLVEGPRPKPPKSQRRGFFGGRPRGSRVKGRVADGVDRTGNREIIAAAKSLARELSRAPGRPPFKSWTLGIEPDGEDPVRVILDLDYGELSPAPKGHGQDMDRAVHALALAMQPRHPDDRSGLKQPPTILGEVMVRRTLTFANASGEQRAFPVDTVRVPVDAALNFSPVLHRLSSQCGTSSMPPGPLYALSATGTSLIVVGLSLLLAGAGLVRKVFHPVICAGRMALTLYLAHVVVGMTVIQALGYGNMKDLAAIVTCIACCQVGSMAFAAWWLSLFRRGPVETCMRWITG